MARPKKQSGELRTDYFKFRLTPSERLQIEAAAHKAGMIASEYARTQTLKGHVVVNEHRTLDHAVIDQLRRIGVNLNQLTRMAYVREKMPSALPQLCDDLEQFLMQELPDYGSKSRG